MNVTKDNKKFLWILYVSLLIEALILLLMFSYGTSPFYVSYGRDSLEYKMAGSAILDGLIIFKDIFHQKGGLFFFVQALGEFFCRLFGNNRLGTFFIQSVNMFATTTIMYVSSIHCLSNYDFLYRKKYVFSFIITSSTLFFWIAHIADGNLTEEYSQLYNVIATVISLDFAGRLDFGEQYGKAEFKPVNAFVLGICFAVSLSFRFTNATIIGGVIIFIGIVLVKNKRVKTIFQSIVLGLLGILVIVIPQVIYYYVNDALDEMFYQTFIFNFNYIKNHSSGSVIHNIVWYCFIVGFVLISVVIFVISKKRYVAGLAITLALSNMLMYLAIKITFNNYLQLEAPVLFVILIALASVKFKKLYTPLVSISLCFFILFFGARLYHFLNDFYFVKSGAGKEQWEVMLEETESFYNDVSNLIDDDKNNDMLFLMGRYSGRYGYYYFSRYPFSSAFDADFFTTQKADKYVEKFYDDYENSPPKYIVASNKYINYSEANKNYSEIINDLPERYSMTYTDGTYTLYTLK